MSQRVVEEMVAVSASEHGDVFHELRDDGGLRCNLDRKAGVQGVDAEIGALVLERASEAELVELFKDAGTPEQRWRIVDELADRRYEGDGQ